MTAEVEGVSVSSVYIPNGKHTGHEDFPGKLAWLDALAAHLAAAHRPDAALVVGGDFNVCPAPLDSWNEAALRGHIFHTDEERARFQRLLDQGLFDLFREKNPERARVLAGGTTAAAPSTRARACASTSCSAARRCWRASAP